LPLPKATEAALRKLEARNPGDLEAIFKELARVKEAAAEQYVEYLLEASTSKFLLFAHHKSMMDALEKAVVKHGTEFIRIDGSVQAMQRAGLVERFQREPNCRVAVLSVTAAGEGLTLTAASLCVFCELCPAVPGVIEQAEARIHRIGQRSSVDIHYLVVEGTKDTEVFQRLEQRSLEVARAIGNAGSDAGIPSEPVCQPLVLDDLLGASAPPRAAPAKELKATEAELKAPADFKAEELKASGVLHAQGEPQVPAKRAQAVAKVATVLAQQKRTRRRVSMELSLDDAICQAQAALLKPVAAPAVLAAPVSVADAQAELMRLATATTVVAPTSDVELSKAGGPCAGDARTQKAPARKRLRKASVVEDLGLKAASPMPFAQASSAVATVTATDGSASEDDGVLGFFSM